MAVTRQDQRSKTSVTKDAWQHSEDARATCTFHSNAENVGWYVLSETRLP